MSRRRVIAFVGSSGSGKTTLICKLLPHLKKSFPIIAVIKHTHHDGPSETGDTSRFLAAGADRVVLASSNRAWVWPPPEVRAGATPYGEATELLSLVDASLVIIEGLKHETSWPRILVERRNVASPRLEGTISATVGEERSASPRTFTHDDIPELAIFVDTITSE